MAEEKKTNKLYMCFAPRFIEWELSKLKKKDKYWKINYISVIHNMWKADDSWEDIYAVWVYKSEIGWYIRSKEDIKKVFNALKKFDWDIQIVDWDTAQILKDIK